ncbi:class I SAM-dependent RNA methyltransferase [Betaproteobacteria bacterium PRO4]|uniref:THUMP domain-containing class I SAM-dependent RNA methyltransferase n=1 Tax=Nitrosomonas sp. TaxID=42353 RepID=UPI00255E46F8|nr:THUMP domain-containing protein [Nitrosomonas sp.]MDL1866302.1 class I SAM-dependent RNA methyltransferase [Betaproteobacteria bacterium PRO4]
MTEHFFAPCPRGLESVLAAELEQLDAASIQPSPGGVAFQGDWRTCYRANLESRIASRVLWQITRHSYRSEADIYDLTHALPWQDWFEPGLSIKVNLAAIKCPLRSLDFVTLRIKDAVCDKFRATRGKRPDIDTASPDMRVHGFLDAQKFTLYLDTSGEALFKRGLRQTQGEAPLRENLAAGILALAGWHPGTPLLDPMCGSGTLLLEAAQIACRIAPGSGRQFAFEKLKLFDAGNWKKLKQTATSRQLERTFQSIYGSDLYGSALAHARHNLAAAELAECVTLKQANVLEISPPAETGILVSNPPYGMRIGDQQELAVFYPQLGNVLKQRFSGWRAFLLTADPMLPKTIRLTPSRRIPLFNGALECRLLEYRLVAGSMRKTKSPDAPEQTAATHEP